VIAPVAVAGVGLAWFVYGSGRIDWVALRVRYASLNARPAGLLRDDAYAMVLGDGGKLLAAPSPRSTGAGWTAWWAHRAGTGMLAVAGRRIQTGLVRTYAGVPGGVVGIL
jgi:hypothetical protein